MNLTKPDKSDLEVILFGPGYGECILIHVEGEWIVIDSCPLAGVKEPAAITYLEQIGVDLATEVSLLVATHWHDDHIRGFSQLVEACRSADVYISGAFQHREFLSFVYAYHDQPKTGFGSGVDEIYRSISISKDSGRRLGLAVPNRSILVRDSSSTSHGKEIRLWTLSPSDAEITAFLTEIGTGLLELPDSTKRRAHPRRPNHASVVCWLDCGTICFLFGSDMEVASNTSCGWHAIVEGRQALGKAALFKVPHHGSESGHLPAVWSELLIDQPISLVTPFRRGSVALPKATDMDRIAEMSSVVYLTASPTNRGQGPSRSRSSDKLIRRSTKNGLRTAYLSSGAVRYRMPIDASREASVSYTNGAIERRG